MSSERVPEDVRWQELAACRGVDPNIFFPPRGNSRQKDVALSYCNRCPVKRACLDENINRRDGIYGGTTARERKIMRQKLAARRPCAECKQPFSARGTATICSQECRDVRNERLRRERQKKLEGRSGRVIRIRPERETR